MAASEDLPPVFTRYLWAAAAYEDCGSFEPMPPATLRAKGGRRSRRLCASLSRFAVSSSAALAGREGFVCGSTADMAGAPGGGNLCAASIGLLDDGREG